MVYFYKKNLKKKMKKQLQNQHKLYIIHNKRGHTNEIQKKEDIKTNVMRVLPRNFLSAMFFAFYHNSSDTILRKQQIWYPL